MDICQKSKINSNHINETDFSSKVNSKINKDNKIMVPVMVEIDKIDLDNVSLSELMKYFFNTCDKSFLIELILNYARWLKYNFDPGLKYLDDQHKFDE